MKSKLFWGVMVALLAGGAWWWQTKGHAKEEAPAFREVVVERATLRRTVQATGVVRPQNRVEIKPPIPGRIDRVLVREGQTVAQGEILAWMSSSERAALLDAARARGPKELAYWEDLYRAAPLLAPLEGTIIARAIEPGQTVVAADAVLVLADRLIVQAQVDETDIGLVATGQPAHVELDAYPGSSIDARVDHVAYEATTVNNVTIYEVDILPAEAPPGMRAGMTAQVALVLEERADVLGLPVAAVVREEGRVWAQLADPQAEGGVRRVPVRLGLEDGALVEVLEGLVEGDRVRAPLLAMPSSAPAGRNPFSPMGGRPRR